MKFIISLLLIYITCVSAWDDGDFEVFDVVEEVNTNFYELLGVSQDATPQEIKSSFKKLTLKLHPDKNDAPDADVQFRNLVSVHNILKDPAKREKYNEVLKNGLPNWRSAVYYYRHVRKMGLAEGSFILFIIVSFGQYAVSWASYLEKKYTTEQVLTSRKKSKKTADIDTSYILDQLPKPSILNTLPFQIPRAIWWTVIGTPAAVIGVFRFIKEMSEQKLRQQILEEQERKRAEREALELEKAKAARAAAGPRKRKGFVPTERQCLLDAGEDPNAEENRPEEEEVHKRPPPVSGGLWTDDDLMELVRLVKKYPGGTPDRWDRIADAMCRPVPEVTHMAHKMKDTMYKVQPQEDIPQPDPPRKVKTRKADEISSGGNWNQQQQKALESALAKYPKGGAGDRWERIGNAVPGKTKEECMMRCKYLSDLVKKQKMSEEERSNVMNGNATSEAASDATQQDKVTES